jgi:hypothetical protein
MTIVVGKDMTTRNYVKSHVDINMKENTKLQSISIQNEEEYEELQKKRRHLPLVHKRDNIGRDIVCMKIVVLKSCLKRLEM